MLVFIFLHCWWIWLSSMSVFLYHTSVTQEVPLKDISRDWALSGEPCSGWGITGKDCDTCQLSPLSCASTSGGGGGGGVRNGSCTVPRITKHLDFLPTPFTLSPTFTYSPRSAENSRGAQKTVFLGNLERFLLSLLNNSAHFKLVLFSTMLGGTHVPSYKTLLPHIGTGQ